jgi:hypothetical protein
VEDNMATKNIYSNLPTNKIQADATVQAFDNYYLAPIELSASTLAAMIGFFTQRGFDATSAETVAVIIMKQAKRDGYNPMQILDTLSGITALEISALVAEILNYNRVKTSFLGYSKEFTPHDEVQRNVLA